MKNLKFSRLFAAVTFVAILALAGCKQQVEESKPSIYGTWTASQYEKYTITETTFAALNSYEGNNLKIFEDDETSGRIFIKYTKAYEESYTEPADPDDWIHYKDEESNFEMWYRYTENAPDVGKWYAIYYFDLTDDAVKISAAAGPIPSCDTLEEAKETFTVANGYMSKAAGKYSSCTRE